MAIQQEVRLTQPGATEERARLGACAEARFPPVETARDTGTVDAAPEHESRPREQRQGVHAAHRPQRRLRARVRERIPSQRYSRHERARCHVREVADEVPCAVVDAPRHVQKEELLAPLPPFRLVGTVAHRNRTWRQLVEHAQDLGGATQLAASDPHDGHGESFDDPRRRKRHRHAAEGNLLEVQRQRSRLGPG